MSNTRHNDAEGHRERLRQRVQNEGMEHFQPYEVLEFILTYAIPRKDVKPIAKRLIAEYGSVSAVLEADWNELAQVEGLGPASATLIASLLMVIRYYHKERWMGIKSIPNYGQMGKYCAEYLYGETSEKMILVCLDNACNCKGTFVVGEGGIDATPVFLDKIMRKILACGAKQAVLAHNHPSGMTTPSQSDCETTRAIHRALAQMNIRLLAHFVVSGKEYRQVQINEPKEQLRLRDAAQNDLEDFSEEQQYLFWEEEE